MPQECLDMAADDHMIAVLHQDIRVVKHNLLGSLPMPPAPRIEAGFPLGYDCFLITPDIWLASLPN